MLIFKVASRRVVPIGSSSASVSSALLFSKVEEKYALWNCPRMVLVSDALKTRMLLVCPQTPHRHPNAGLKKAPSVARR